MIRYVFPILATSTMILINYYTYSRFLKKVEFFINFKVGLKWAIVLITVLEIVFFIALKSNSLNPKIFYFIAALIGVSFMLFIITLIYDFFQLSILKFDHSRRVALKIFLDATMVILAFSYIFKGFVDGVKKPKIKKEIVKISNLNEPLSIVQISDVHIGKTITKEFLQEIVNSINELKADIVAITGDLIDIDAQKIKDELDPLKDIENKYGTYFVPGNHEYFHGVDGIIEHLGKLNVKTLGNENLQVGGVNLVGVYDLLATRMGHEKKPNLKAALKGVDRNLPTILLTHQPKFANFVNGKDKIDLILSGHTHAGQIFPFGYLVLLDQPYLYGLYNHNKNTQIYVSSGTGYWGPPIRFKAPSEIVKIELRRA